jgi:hypothetical protein
MCHKWRCCHTLCQAISWPLAWRCLGGVASVSHSRAEWYKENLIIGQESVAGLHSLVYSCLHLLVILFLVHECTSQVNDGKLVEVILDILLSTDTGIVRATDCAHACLGMLNEIFRCIKTWKFAILAARTTTKGIRSWNGCYRTRTLS